MKIGSPRPPAPPPPDTCRQPCGPEPRNSPAPPEADAAFRLELSPDAVERAEDARRGADETRELIAQSNREAVLREGGVDVRRLLDLMAG